MGRTSLRITVATPHHPRITPISRPAPPTDACCHAILLLLHCRLNVASPIHCGYGAELSQGNEMGFELVRLSIEDVGGFVNASASLKGNRVLIGPNNGGKTGLLRILSWLMCDMDLRLLEGQRTLNQAECDLLVPARETKNRARRLLVKVQISDGRTARRFVGSPGERETTLRVQFRKNRTYARLGRATRGEKPESTDQALELIHRLQDAYATVYIDAFRQGASADFQRSLADFLARHFRDALQPQGRGKRPTTVSDLKHALETSRKIGEEQASVAWELMEASFPGAPALGTKFEVPLSPDTFLKWAAESAEPRFTLGAQDSNRVGVSRLGAGTQSILSMMLAATRQHDGARPLLLVEEPEAFLHPSAQRTIAEELIGLPNTQVILSTHSPTVLAESPPASLLVINNHRVFSPDGVNEIQERKDETLLSTAAAHAMFSSGILLVEGPGDLAFFETLRRRMHPAVSRDILSRMHVVQVGGKTSFGPWIRLLGRYRAREANSTITAYSLTLCADSGDAGAHVLRAVKDSDITVPQDFRSAVNNLLAGGPLDDSDRRDHALLIEDATVRLPLLNHRGLQVSLMPVDLEFTSTRLLSNDRAIQFGSLIGLPSGKVKDSASLASALGSKGGSTAPSENQGAKAPYVRAELARYLRSDEVSDGLKMILGSWIRSAGGALPTGDLLAQTDLS